MYLGIGDCLLFIFITFRIGKLVLIKQIEVTFLYPVCVHVHLSILV